MQRPLLKPVRIGTRGSPLALYQARLVQSRLKHVYDMTDALCEEMFPITCFTTSGDTFQGELSQFGGKGLFTKELERALILRHVDIAVHSMKDVPTVSQPELEISVILEREDPRDAFISPQFARLTDLPYGAVVGTASIRRRAQLLSMRPDIQFTLLRGSVGTRLEKLARGDCMATFLAYAGLKRLNQTENISEIIETQTMLPAPAQGAIGIETRKNDKAVKACLAPLDHRATHFSVQAERAFLRALNGSCRTPIAALARFQNNHIEFEGAVFSQDGTVQFQRQDNRICENRQQAETLGQKLGEDLRREIGDRILWDES